MANSRPHVFVSFTKRGADGEFVSTRLLPGLHRQALKVWIFEDEEGEIPAGQEIRCHLYERIDCAQVFLAVVSQGAFDSEYARAEVEYAQRRPAAAGPLLIIPWVSKQLRESGRIEWPVPFRPLQGLRHREIDFDSPASLEDAIVELCQKDLRIQYQTPPLVDPRLPFVDRFYKEVREQCPRRDDREAGIYCRLLELLHRFSAAFQAQQFEHARWTMQFFCMMCEYEFPHSRFYYSYVVRAVCEQLAGDVAAAEATLQALLTHPLVDETTFTAFGHIRYLKKDYEQALRYYRTALAHCPEDAAAAHGILLSSVMCGQPADLDETFRVINHAQLQKEDRATVKQVKAFALAEAGRFAEASELFNDLVQHGLADATAIVHFARMLTRQGKPDQALQQLQRHRASGNAVLLHDLATLLATQGQWREAIGVYNDLVEHEPQNRRYRLELAQVHWWLKDKKAARRTVAPLLDFACQPLPQTAEDFYFDGFAQWILGDAERAEYDFERSRFAPQCHYRILIGA